MRKFVERARWIYVDIRGWTFGAVARAFYPKGCRMGRNLPTRTGKTLHSLPCRVQKATLSDYIPQARPASRRIMP
jgi:hypothetical protein